MRRTMFLCDKCGKEINEQTAEVYQIYRHDFCEKCAREAEELIKQWIEPVKKARVNNDAVFDKKPKAKIDWPKACALKKAGWSNHQIAEELGINEGTVNAMIYEKMKEGQQ